MSSVNTGVLTSSSWIYGKRVFDHQYQHWNLAVLRVECSRVWLFWEKMRTCIHSYELWVVWKLMSLLILCCRCLYAAQVVHLGSVSCHGKSYKDDTNWRSFFFVAWKVMKIQQEVDHKSNPRTWDRHEGHISAHFLWYLCLVSGMDSTLLPSIQDVAWYSLDRVSVEQLDWCLYRNVCTTIR